MQKVKVLFPRVEAGFGHIMPCNAVEEIFSRKYGDKVEVINQYFFNDNNDETLYRYGKWLNHQVEIFQKYKFVGQFASFNLALWGVNVSTWGTMVVKGRGAAQKGIEAMDKIKPDLVFSTHWATNYYAANAKCHPITVMYCPDTKINNLFKYKADHLLISSGTGFFYGLRDRRVNRNTLRLVPNCIRNEAYQVRESKEESRKRLNIPNDKFVVVLAEGGFGNGNMLKIINHVIKENLKVTLIPICGTNKKAYYELKTLDIPSNVTLLPQGFVKDIFSYINAADLFCGKGGSMIGEPTFFGVPSIITSVAQVVEFDTCDYYVNEVKCAIKEFSPSKVAKLIADFIDHPEKLEPYKTAAKKHHSSYGAERTADFLWEILKEKFPELQ